MGKAQPISLSVCLGNRIPAITTKITELIGAMAWCSMHMREMHSASHNNWGSESGKTQLLYQNGLYTFASISYR